MARETAAQKLARRNAELEAERESGAPPSTAPSAAPSAAPVKAGPVLADYMIFGQDVLNYPSEPTKGIVTWVLLGEVKAPTHPHALEMAKDAMRERRIAAATEEAPAPATLRVTVGAVAKKNWNQGTAIIESRPVTTWEK